jgi:hypothetical protein
MPPCPRYLLHLAAKMQPAAPPPTISTATSPPRLGTMMLAAVTRIHTPKKIPDIRDITDQWMKKFGELIARLNIPTPITDPKLLSVGTPSAPTMTTTPGAPPTHLPRPHKCLTSTEMMKHDHKCKNLFDITAVNDYDTKDIDNSLLMMIDTTQSTVRGSPPMFLAGAILGTSVNILVDMGATHNVLDINVT